MKINLNTRWGILLGLVFCLGLYGCGQTGALYLPKDTHVEDDD